MENIIFFIPGEPVSQGRPRFARAGRHVRTYDPKKSRDWKAYVREVAARYAPKALLMGPLYVRMEFVRAIPKSMPKWAVAAIVDGVQPPNGKNTSRLIPTTKPDVTNLVKGVEDALTGIIWHDDAQIAMLKAMSAYGVHPGVYVKISSAVITRIWVGFGARIDLELQ